jgi:hypothetical protein
MMKAVPFHNDVTFARKGNISSPAIQQHVTKVFACPFTLTVAEASARQHPEAQRVISNELAIIGLKESV